MTQITPLLGSGLGLDKTAKALYIECVRWGAAVVAVTGSIPVIKKGDGISLSMDSSPIYGNLIERANYRNVYTHIV